jgi:hypothetical protein
VTDFKHGRTSIQEEHRSGHPKNVTPLEMVAKIHDMALKDRRLKLSEIAIIVGISKERVFNILTQELGMRKPSVQWVPRLLYTRSKLFECKFRKSV